MAKADTMLTFSIVDANTLPVAVDGFSFSWMLKKTSVNPDSAALLNNTNSSGISIAGPVVTVTFKAADTATFTPGAAVAELKRLDLNYETVVATGVVSLIRRVHRV
jgi:hypothetical protein